jgi:hypothetical protein
MSGAGESDATAPPSLLLLIADFDGYHVIARHADKLHLHGGPPVPLVVLFGGQDKFPFKPRPSTILLPGMPAGVIACAPAMDEVGIASRLASPEGLPGCYDGPVTELAERWLRSLDPEMLTRARILVSAADETASAVEALGRAMNISVSRLEADARTP